MSFRIIIRLAILPAGQISNQLKLNGIKAVRY
jgi:hypothetical protein